jgi:hypothetical protein
MTRDKPTQDKTTKHNLTRDSPNIVNSVNVACVCYFACEHFMMLVHDGATAMYISVSTPDVAAAELLCSEC